LQRVVLIIINSMTQASNCS